MIYDLDACALIAFLDDEEGADRVEALLERAENGEISVFISIVNLIEVCYDRLRLDPAKMQAFLALLDDFPITVVRTISDDVYLEAARIKAIYKRVSVADAIGIATAESLDAAFVTSDHHELDVVDAKEDLNFYWFR
jgi:predicted nucleic acid-binding protein